MKLNELLADFAKVDTPLEIAGIAIDSREVKPDYVFIALTDATVNYVRQAIDRGASIILFEQDSTDFQSLQNDVSCVQWIGVENLTDKLAEIAARYYNYPARNLDIIGITGTNGKTSCSQFLAQLLTDSMVIGTLGWGMWGNVKFTGYTTPNAVVLQRVLAETVALGKKTVVMEVSSHGVQEKRIDQTFFKGAVFTNLSRDHLDYHNSMEEYFNAKLQLFKRPELQFAVVNCDDEYGQKIIAAVAPSVALWTFSKQEQISSARCVQAKNINCSINGLQFEVCCDNQTAVINSRLYGEFNVENMLAVLTTLLALGFSLNDAAEKISALQSVPGRMEYFGGGDLPSVFVDFAHTPDALEKLLNSLKKHNPEQLILVFGCGGNRDSGKRPLMGKIATRLADKVIITDDNPRFENNHAIIADILSGCEDDKVDAIIANRAMAIRFAIAWANKNDCVVIAGKGHEDYQEVNGVKTPFSDQAIVKKMLKIWEKDRNELFFKPPRMKQ